jgi:hypothetical protein
VKNKDKILETSDWHFESGGDFWATYLDNDSERLGSGDFEYKIFKPKYPEK